MNPNHATADPVLQTTVVTFPGIGYFKRSVTKPIES
jgi:hypothetical protein